MIRDRESFVIGLYLMMLGSNLATTSAMSPLLYLAGSVACAAYGAILVIRSIDNAKD